MGAHDGLHIGSRQITDLQRDLLAVRFMAQFLGEVAPGAQNSGNGFEQMHGNADGARLFGNRTINGLANPPGGIGAEFITARASNFPTARIRPTLPSWIKSSRVMPRPRYFFATLTTKRRLARMRARFASKRGLGRNQAPGAEQPLEADSDTTSGWPAIPGSPQHDGQAKRRNPPAKDRGTEKRYRPCVPCFPKRVLSPLIVHKEGMDIGGRIPSMLKHLSIGNHQAKIGQFDAQAPGILPKSFPRGGQFRDKAMVYPHGRQDPLANRMTTKGADKAHGFNDRRKAELFIEFNSLIRPISRK